jgi:hypothetical protein
MAAFHPIIAVNTLREDVRFGEAAMFGWTAQMGAKQRQLAGRGMAAIETRLMKRTFTRFGKPSGSDPKRPFTSGLFCSS